MTTHSRKYEARNRSLSILILIFSHNIACADEDAARDAISATNQACLSRNDLIPADYKPSPFYSTGSVSGCSHYIEYMCYFTHCQIEEQATWCRQWIQNFGTNDHINQMAPPTFQSPCRIVQHADLCTEYPMFVS